MQTDVKLKGIKINGDDFTLKVRQRKVIGAALYHRGRRIAEGVAICNPSDRYDPQEGTQIAITRAIRNLLARKGPGITIIEADGVGRHFFVS